MRRTSSGSIRTSVRGWRPSRRSEVSHRHRQRHRPLSLAVSRGAMPTREQRTGAAEAGLSVQLSASVLLEAAADRRLLLRPRAPLLVNIEGYADFAKHEVSFELS